MAAHEYSSGAPGWKMQNALTGGSLEKIIVGGGDPPRRQKNILNQSVEVQSNVKQTHMCFSSKHEKIDLSFISTTKLSETISVKIPWQLPQETSGPETGNSKLQTRVCGNCDRRGLHASHSGTAHDFAYLWHLTAHSSFSAAVCVL